MKKRKMNHWLASGSSQGGKVQGVCTKMYMPEASCWIGRNYLSSYNSTLGDFQRHIKCNVGRNYLYHCPICSGCPFKKIYCLGSKSCNESRPTWDGNLEHTKHCPSRGGENGCLRASVFLVANNGREYAAAQVKGIIVGNKWATNFRSIQVICALHKPQCKIQAPLYWRGFCRHWALFQW